VASGFEGMNALCRAEFDGSHVCNVTEYIRANSTITPPANGAWITDIAFGIFTDSSGTPTPATGVSMATATAGRWVQANANDCTNWTTANPGDHAPALKPTSVGSTYVNTLCTTALSVACCE
jgi:hypothetical protein